MSSANSFYAPKIGTVSINICGCYIVPVGEYKVVVLHPNSCLRKSCLGVKTLLVPKPKALLTFAFIAFCFFALEYLAQQFASRQLTPLQIFLDGGLAFGTINAGISTSLSDPGILPPELTAEDDEDDEENEDEQDRKTTTNNQLNKTLGLKRRVASLDNLFEDNSDPMAQTSLNPYLLQRGAQDGSDKQYIADFDDFKLSNCKYCQHMRPKGTAHSPRGKCCIMGFDHYCTFLQMDIGERNLRHFIIFLVHCFLCVANAAGAFIKPWFFLIVLGKEDLIENAPQRSYLVLGVMSIVLLAWATILFYMSLNYLIMAFVPGSRSTRDVWRKWCGKNSQEQQPKSDPLPDWHPGYKRQQEERKQQEVENSEIRACKILFGVKESLLPRWTDDLFGFDTTSMTAAANNDSKGDNDNHQAPSAIAEGSTHDQDDDRTELTTIVSKS